MDVLATGPEVKHGDTVTGVFQVGLPCEQAAPQLPTPPTPISALGPRHPGLLFTHTPFPEASSPAPSSRPLPTAGWGRQGSLLLLA